MMGWPEAFVEVAKIVVFGAVVVAVILGEW